MWIERLKEVHCVVVRWCTRLERSSPRGQQLRPLANSLFPPLLSIMECSVGFLKRMLGSIIRSTQYITITHFDTVCRVRCAVQDLALHQAVAEPASVCMCVCVCECVRACVCVVRSI